MERIEQERAMKLSLMAAMSEKLEENRHKEGWQDLGIADCVVRLLEEVDELLEAAAAEDPKEVRREAADVANFAGMIVEKCNARMAK